MADENNNILQSLANAVKDLAAGFKSFRVETNEKHTAFERRIKALEDRPVPKATE
jgi:hypothetical protein